MGLSDSEDGLFGWMDAAEAAVVPGKRQVGKERSFRAPTEESIECVLSWMDELASDAGERVVQAPRPKPRPAASKTPQLAKAKPLPAKAKPLPAKAKPKPAKAKPKPTRRAARPQIMRELGPPPAQSSVVTGRRPQPKTRDDALTASEVWLLGSAPEVALGSDRGRTSKPKSLREFTPPTDAFGSASRAGAYRRPRAEVPPSPPVLQPPRAQPGPVEPPVRPAQPRKVLSAKERRQAIERANGLVDWMTDLMRRWEESSEGEVMPSQPRALQAEQLPPPPPPPPPLPSLATGRLRYDQVEDVFDRAKRLNQRVASFQSELNQLNTPAPAPEPEPFDDEGSQLFGLDTDILYPNPMFETELCSIDPEVEAQRVARPPAKPRRTASHDFDPRDPFDPLARDPFAQAGFDPFSPPDEERRAS